MTWSGQSINQSIKSYNSVHMNTPTIPQHSHSFHIHKQHVTPPTQFTCIMLRDYIILPYFVVSKLQTPKCVLSVHSVCLRADTVTLAAFIHFCVDIFANLMAKPSRDWKMWIKKTFFCTSFLITVSLAQTHSLAHSSSLHNNNTGTLIIITLITHQHLTHHPSLPHHHHPLHFLYKTSMQHI